MEYRRKRFTLDMDPLMQRRLKVIAALKGVTMRQYCLTALDKEIARDEAEGFGGPSFGEEALARLKTLQDEVFRGRKLAGDSADLIREGREARAAVHE